MNIFILDSDPRNSAEMHCDKHVVKMHVEGIQMLVSVMQRYGINHGVYTKAGTLHKGGYANHPCTRWAGDSYANFQWLVKYTAALCEEHTARYGTVPHSSLQICDIIEASEKLLRAMEAEGTAGDLTPFALAMPDEYRSDCAVSSYRNYYIAEKAPICKWAKGRKAPEWFTRGEKIKKASEKSGQNQTLAVTK